MAEQSHLHFEPNYVVPPGETLAETLGALCMGQRELAQRTGRSEKHISQIIRGKARITGGMALLLEQATGVSARLWNNLEANYQTHRARLERLDLTRGEVSRLKDAPYGEMAKLGWVPPARDAVEKTANLLRFLGVHSFRAIDEVHSAAFRVAKAKDPKGLALAAWLRRGELVARDVETEPYSEPKLKGSLAVLRALTRRPEDAFKQGQLQRLCARCGVALVFVPHLKGTYAHGATRWLSPRKALVQLSIRGRYEDVLWFSLFHELGHVLLHGKREVFVETRQMESTEAEQEADRFAADALIPRGDAAKLQHMARHTASSVQTFADEVGVAPSIVVGRLLHEKLVPYRTPLHQLRCRLEWRE